MGVYPTKAKPTRMPNWSKLIADNHAKAHADDGFNLITRLAATNIQLDELSESLGITWPTDFRELYSTFDGFGVATNDEPDKIWWFFRPANEIPKFADDVRNWFLKTHEKCAARFFPFIDFSNGDGIGYIVDDTGVIMDGLFCFEHEQYKFDEEQDVNEFIIHVAVNIEEFLTQIVG